MPIIIDNSLLQQESQEPDDDSAFGYAMMGLVEGIGAGIEKQQAQQQELAKFEREKASQLDILNREQSFKKELFQMEQEANKPLLAAQLKKEGLLADQAALEIEATRRIEEQRESERRNVFRSKYAEAFGDGDITRGNEIINGLEDQLLEAEKSGDKKKADALRMGLTREGERRSSEYATRRSQDYISSILSSDLFAGDDALKMEAQAILNRSDLSVLQKAERIKETEGRASAAFSVRNLNRQFTDQIDREVSRYSDEMTATEDPLKDEELQAQINELTRLRGQAAMVPSGDMQSMQNLINFGREVMFREPRETLRSQRGGQDPNVDASKSLGLELDALDKAQASGYIPEDKLRAAYLSAFDRAYGTGVEPAAGVGPQGEDLGQSIRAMVMGQGKSAAATLDTSGMSLDERKNLVLRINAQEKYKGLSTDESKLRDNLQKGIETEEKGGKSFAEAAEQANQSDQALRSIDYGRYQITAGDVGAAGKFSISKIKNESDANEVAGHLRRVEAILTKRYLQMGVARSGDKKDQDLYTDLGKKIDDVRKAQQVIKNMISKSAFPAAGK
jgi:hypothetical protein